jgi:hypothetical protein
MPVIITGNNTPTAGGITYGDGTTYATTAAGTSGRPIVSGGAGAPTFRPYTLPAADGSANQLLKTDGAGALSFATVSAGFTLGTPVATTSGTSIDFTGIPAGTKQIVISFKGVSLNSTSQVLIQLGDAGGIETTSYAAVSVQISTSVNTLFSSNGFRIRITGIASNALSGSVTLMLENSTTFSWAATGIVGDAANVTDEISVVCGSKSLSAELDRVRITTVSGTDTFDAGEINIAYI